MTDDRPLPPIRRHVVVAATPDRAFQAWRDEIGSWWPLERFSVFGPGATVAFVGDEIVETSPTGQTSRWGSVTESHPPHRLRFTWHPGHDDERGTVEVTFLPVGDERTLVSLEHRGWEHFPDPAAARDEYRNGWPLVVERYASTLHEASATEATAWLILSHTAGAAAGDGPIFGHPLFAEHVAFLRAVEDAGVLVAAGPLPDDPGNGQTIIRVPASDAEKWVAAAHADGSVAGDLFVLRVRPWAVRSAGV